MITCALLQQEAAVVAAVAVFDDAALLPCNVVAHRLPHAQCAELASCTHEHFRVLCQGEWAVIGPGLAGMEELKTSIEVATSSGILKIPIACSAKQFSVSVEPKASALGCKYG